MPANPILDFEIDKAALQYTGQDLQRPECILAEPDGTLWAADARGGVVTIRPDGSQNIVTQQRSEHFQDAGSEATRFLQGTLPNGLAFARNGDILISNFGTDCLEVMSRDGPLEGARRQHRRRADRQSEFRPPRFRDRIWVTVSTKIKNWMHALRTDLPDGYIVLYESGTFRVVAEGFHFTNEIRFDAKEEYLYVVETTGGCVSRLRVDDKGNLSNREVFGPASLGKGAWPDGIAFDSFGNLWGTMVYSDKLFVLTPARRPPDSARRRRSRKGRCTGAAVLQESRNRRRSFCDWTGCGAVDGERHVRRAGSADGLYWIAEGQADSVFPLAGRRAADGALGGKSLPASDKRHLVGHHRHEQHVGVERQARHIDDGVGHVLHVHPRFGFLAAVGLGNALRHPLGQRGDGVADIDLAGDDVVLAPVERDALGQPRDRVFGRWCREPRRAAACEPRSSRY